MAEFTSDILNDVLAACTAGAVEAAGAIGRTFDAEISLALGESATLTASAMPDELNGPGLAILFLVGNSGAVLAIPESSGFVPSWCASPDATGQSKLATLAQELGMLLLPEAFMPEDFKSARVDKLSEALIRGGLGESAAAVSLNLSSADGKQGVAQLVWPLTKPAAVLESPATSNAEKATAPATAAVSAVAPAVEPNSQPAGARRPRQRSLPGYTKSLLKIKVPVVVTLAEKKQPLAQILEMGPGMIIQFEKSCEDSLQLEIGDHKVAAGEAIKVGDKFGLRVTEIILPEERFSTVGSRVRA
jgi:flagellar motor switch/type III secretory pathway protein FliN